MRKRTKKQRELIIKFLAYFVLITACLIVLLPFSIVISTSLKTYADSVRIPFRFYMGYLDFSAYKEIFASNDILVGLKNTLFVVLPIMVTGVFFSSLSAYAFSKIKFKGKAAMFTILLGSMMLPGIITMTPAYLIYDMLGWTDTFKPLMLPNLLGTAACTFYMRQYFKGIPDSVIEAAEIDGLSNFGIFIRIVLPLSRPALVAQLMLWFIAGYNDYFGPMLYLNNKSKFTLQLMLNLIAGSAENRWPKVMAASIVVMMPALILYLIFQKYFIQGITLSAGKED